MADFILPDGSRFDVGVGLGDDAPEFRDYHGFLEETKRRLKHYGYKPRMVEEISSIHAEVGDDEIDVSSNVVYPAAELAVYSKYLGVVVSEEDTSLNSRFGNYAEDLVIVPDGYEQTYHYAQNTSGFRDMSFIDVPKLRLAIDIRPGRMTHSATNDGKAGMLGSRLAWIPRDAPTRCLWEVFNLFQDINLGLMRDDKFAYLPTALGGYGKPIPFGLKENFENIIARYKQGAHRSLCRELVRRTNRRFREYTAENRFSNDEVLSAVSRVQSSWHDWVKGNSLYAPTCWLEAPPEVAQFRVATHGEDLVLDGVLKRLEAAGYLVSENDLAIAYEHNMLCQYLVGTETHKEFLEKREEKRKEWINLSTFSLRLYGMIEKIGIDQSLQHRLDPMEVGEFVNHLTKSRINLRSFLRKEPFYSSKAKDFVYLNGPMMVNVDLHPRVTQVGRRYWFTQTRDSQDQESETPEAFQALYDWVADPNRGPRPPSLTLVGDDPFIIREIALLPEETGACIITDDIKLCREAYMKTRKWVVRIPCKWYYISVYFGDGDNPWEGILSHKYPMRNWVTIQDTGSIQSYEEIGFRDGNILKWPMYRPFSMTAVSMRDGHRVRTGPTKVPFEEDFEWKPYRFPEGYMYSYTNVLQRRKHPHRRGWA